MVEYGRFSAPLSQNLFANFFDFVLLPRKKIAGFA